MSQSILPLSIINQSDLHRANRELNDLNQFLADMQSRQPGVAMSLPKTSNRLNELSVFYGLNLLDEAQRSKLADQISQLEKSSPQVHISFASAPSADFRSKLVEWFRTQIHPSLLIDIGLQPTIAAGCILRTTNKYFDFSLRSHFEKNKQTLIESLREIR